MDEKCIEELSKPSSGELTSIFMTGRHTGGSVGKTGEQPQLITIVARITEGTGNALARRAAEPSQTNGHKEQQTQHLEKKKKNKNNKKGINKARHKIKCPASNCSYIHKKNRSFSFIKNFNASFNVFFNL
jgi:hypothetical protein